MIHMRKKCILVCLLVAAMMLFVSVAHAATGTVTASSLVLREQANSTSKALQTLPNGTKLEILKKEGDWYKVSYGKYTGYVYASYISTTVSAEQKDDGTLKKGDKGSDVKELQQRLKELGYYKSTCDGSYGNVTVTAVKAFQKKNGLEADGVAGPTTLKKLNSSSAISATGKTETQKEEVKDDGTLQKGDKGAEVKKLQQRLKELGYYKYGIDSDYGNRTVEAVKAFQKKNGLNADGIAGPSTLKKLNSSSAIGANDKTEKEEEKEETKDDGTLQKGDKGTEVKKLQERLKELGYYKYGIDSEYGYRTVEAVKAFQKKNGLDADGVAGPTTLKKLNSSSAVAANTATEPESDKLNTSQTLKSGNSGNQVKLLQQRLKELGYYNTAVDGSYGYRTLKAVRDFQATNGLTVDGVAGPTTLVKLMSSSAKKAGEGTANNDTTTDSSTLQKGASGAEVKKLQQRLKELGYYKYGIDSSYGDRTVEAVKAFQKKNGLNADGVAGEATLKKLNSSSAISANGSDNVTLNTSQTLQKGDSGAQVKALQTRLKELGYYNTTIDSDYGYRTATAVSEFQKANGLTVNGIANSTTLRKLVSSSAVSKSEADKADKEENKDTYVTERLDWFNGGRAVFANRPIIEIKDVRTGLVFKGKVLYGSNHLDVEPLTAADTAILLRINGGVEFKWYRRPMLVKINGHVYASSIYSVPHGEQTIYNNNYEGQFCLHFYGSKTHGTDEVKADHQAAIAEAMKATW